MAAGNNHFGNRNDQCWVYRSTFPDGDLLYGAVDIFLKPNDISQESKRNLLVHTTVRFYEM